MSRETTSATERDGGTSELKGYRKQPRNKKMAKMPPCDYTHLLSAETRKRLEDLERRPTTDAPGDVQPVGSRSLPHVCRSSGGPTGIHRAPGQTVGHVLDSEEVME